MIYVISKSTFGNYDVRDIQCNANWDCCPYSDYALIPDNLVEGVLATQGYCDITLNADGTEVTGFTARSIPSVPEECCSTNTVLSVNGVKADTNGAVSLTPDNVGAAPAGYGLGTNEPPSKYYIAELDNLKASGWAKIVLYDGDILGITQGTLVIDAGDRYVKQTLISWFAAYGGFCEIVRVWYYGDSEWKPWEWVNPAMVVGVEYRTTERYNGKPVYAMQIDCGVAPSSSEAWVEIKDANGNIPDIDNLVEMNATIKAGSNYVFSVPNADGDISAFFHKSGGSPKVIVKASGSSFAENGYHVYAVLKYTKSTD